MQSRNSALIIVAAAVTLVVVVVLGGWFMWGGGVYRGGMMGGFGFGMPLLFGGLMLLPMLALPVLLILGLAWLVVTVGRGSTVAPQAGTPTPQDILNNRYARGEITKEQYDEVRQHLAV